MKQGKSEQKGRFEMTRRMRESEKKSTERLQKETKHATSSRLLKILMTKPEEDGKVHVYKRNDEWPGVKSVNFSKLKGHSQSVKEVKRQALSNTHSPQNVKHFNRVVLDEGNLQLFPSNRRKSLHLEKAIKPRKSTQLRMDRYQSRTETRRGVQNVIQDLVLRDKVNRNYKIDFEAFNFIDKVIDFRDMWKDFVHKKPMQQQLQ